MRMCLCPEHERALRQTNWLAETGHCGQCGLCGCANMGAEFELTPINYRRPRRSYTPGIAPKDNRAHHKGEWRDWE